MCFVAMQLLKEHLLKGSSLGTEVVINEVLAAVCAFSVFVSSTKEICVGSC